MDDLLLQYFQLPADSSDQDKKAAILDQINFLVKNDLQKLIFILYRVDVNENKMRHALEQSAGTDAAEIIYNMIVERENEKAESRKNNTMPFDRNAEEESW